MIFDKKAQIEWKNTTFNLHDGNKVIDSFRVGVENVFLDRADTERIDPLDYIGDDYVWVWDVEKDEYAVKSIPNLN